MIGGHRALLRAGAVESQNVYGNRSMGVSPVIGRKMPVLRPRPVSCTFSGLAASAAEGGKQNQGGFPAGQGDGYARGVGEPVVE